MRLVAEVTGYDGANRTLTYQASGFPNFPLSGRHRQVAGAQTSIATMVGRGAPPDRLWFGSVQRGRFRGIGSKASLKQGEALSGEVADVGGDVGEVFVGRDSAAYVSR